MASTKRIFLNPGWLLSRAESFTNFGLDQTTDQLEVIFQVRDAMTITKLGVRYGARTGTPPTYKISLQGVDGATGFPDGTIKGGGSPASTTFTPPADGTWDNTWRELTLDNSFAATRGQLLALVVAYSAGSVDASNFSSFTAVSNISPSADLEALPYVIQNNAGTRTKQSKRADFSYLAGTDVFGQPSLAAYTLSAVTLNSTPDELATTFTLPRAWAGRYRLAGVRWFITTAPAGKTFKVILYSGTTVLNSVTLDTDNLGRNSSSFIQALFTDVDLTTLLGGNQYRVAIQPQDAVGSYVFPGFQVNANADWNAYPLGVDWYASTRTDAGAWSDMTDTRVNCELILDDVIGNGPHWIG